MTNTAHRTDTYAEAKAIVVAALAGTDRDNPMTADDLHSITGDLPLTMSAGRMQPWSVDDLAARGAEIAGSSYRGFYLRRVRHNGRS